MSNQLGRFPPSLRQGQDEIFSRVHPYHPSGQTGNLQRGAALFQLNLESQGKVLPMGAKSVKLGSACLNRNQTQHCPGP